MTWIKTSDPLALLAIQSGQTTNPSTQKGAAASSPLNVDQRSIDIGEPVPIVFARRRNDAGGILISPGATEARFENDASNNVTASYLLVLSEGQLDSIPVKDILQGACRVGSHTQTYNRRAGTWLPGNYIVQRVGYDKPEASYICGSVGLYPGMTTLSFQYTVPNGFDYWRRQVHLFIRGGIHVTRLYDSVLGPSDNFADLVYWMLANNGRVPTALIDTTALTEAAQFLEVNGFACNCWLQEARNYSDLLTSWAPYFLLSESSVNGKKGLRSLLPINNDGTLKTTEITPEYTFTEADILPGTLEIDYTSWSDRQPFVAQMIWRQELGTDAAIIRTAEVQLSGAADGGPYESHDLSAFCTSETHAVKAGAYILARRIYVSHTIRFSAKPQAHNTLLVPGSIIRVALERKASGGNYSAHDYFYQVERITKTLAGDVSYECSHFPVDTEQRSIVAQLVAAATGTGILLTSNSSGAGCDINSPTDETIPAEEYIVPDDANDPGGLDIGTGVATEAGESTVLNTSGLTDAGSGATLGDGGGLGPRTPANNPSDTADVPSRGPFITAPEPGGAAGVPPAGVCPGARIIRTVCNMNTDVCVTEEIPDWTIGFKPPQGTGLNNYNNSSISFRFICPDNREETIDTVYPSGVINIPSQTITVTVLTRLRDVRDYCSSGASLTNSDTNTITTFTYDNVVSVTPSSGGWHYAACGCGVECIINNPTGSSIALTYANGTTANITLASINLIGVSSTQSGERSWGSWILSISGSLAGPFYTWDVDPDANYP